VNALTILLEPWAGHRRGAAVVIERSLAERLEALGVCRIVVDAETPEEPMPEESGPETDKPMKRQRRSRRGRE